MGISIIVYIKRSLFLVFSTIFISWLLSQLPQFRIWLFLNDLFIVLYLVSHHNYYNGFMTWLFLNNLFVIIHLVNYYYLFWYLCLVDLHLYIVCCSKVLVFGANHFHLAWLKDICNKKTNFITFLNILD